MDVLVTDITLGKNKPRNVTSVKVKSGASFVDTSSPEFSKEAGCDGCILSEFLCNAAGHVVGDTTIPSKIFNLELREKANCVE